MTDQSPGEIVRQASTLSILWGVLLIVFGMFAVGVSMVISGVTRVMLSLAVRKVAAVGA